MDVYYIKLALHSFRTLYVFKFVDESEAEMDIWYADNNWDDMSLVIIIRVWVSFIVD